jgi:hypothetical protein
VGLCFDFFLFACIEDVDFDGICDADDPHCNLDSIALSCRRLAPECPRGTVPEVRDGCYTDVCVTWDICLPTLPPEPGLCGGRNMPECPQDMYCMFPPGTMCGASDIPGVCMPLEPEMACIEIYEPVCGCDGMTYSNECFAMAAGASIDHPGACDREPPVGGEVCGGRAGDVCPQGTYCDYPLEAMCGFSDLPGICAPLGEPECPAIFMPVCGCDGMTYSNDCQARAAGVSIAAFEACIERIQCGGFAGLVCPDGLTCVDDPTDDCDPERGGADCMGVCVGR